METLEEVFLDCLGGDVICSSISCGACPGHCYDKNGVRLCAIISDFAYLLGDLRVRDTDDE